MEYKYEWMNGVFVNNDFWRGKNFPLYVLNKETGMKNYFGHVHKDEFKGKVMIMNPDLRDDQQFWDFACATAPDICCYVPRKFHTPELLKVIATNTSWKENLCWMNMERVEREAGKDVAEEIYAIMAFRFYEAISDIPVEYLTDKVVNPSLTKHILALSKLPIEQRTLDRCVLSVSTWGRSLRSVPEDKRCEVIETADGNRKLYEIALAVDPMSLSAVPDNELTSEICLNAVKRNPLAISYVPVRFITPDFVQELKENNVVLSPKDRCYLVECINVWAKRNGVIELPAVEFNMLLVSSENTELKSIKLVDMPYMFSKKILDKLESCGIINLSQLFEIFDNGSLVLDSLFVSGDSSLELAGTINTLNCKFRGRDPKLDLDSRDYSYMQSKLGLPKAFAREACNRGFSIGELLEELNEPYAKQIWNNFGCWCRVGEGTINSAIEKLAIISDYYSNITANKKRENEIEMLNEELLRLQQKSAVLDAQINRTLQRIVELKDQRKADSGVSYVKK